MAKVRPRPGVRGKTPGLNLIWVYVQNSQASPQGSSVFYDSLNGGTPTTLGTVAYTFPLNSNQTYGDLPTGSMTSTLTSTQVGQNLSPGLHTITSSFVSRDSARWTNSDSSNSVPVTVNVLDTAASLQQRLDSDPNTPDVLYTFSNSDLQTIFADVNGLRSNTVETVTIITSAFTGSDVSINGPNHVNLTITGAATIVGGSPAVNFTGGILTLSGLTLTTSTASPVVNVTGGLLTLTGDTINAAGGGDLIDNYSLNTVSAVGNTFQISGTPLTGDFAISDKIHDGLDSTTSGPVYYVANQLYVTPNTLSTSSNGRIGIQRAIDLFNANTSLTGDLVVNVENMSNAVYSYVGYTLSLSQAHSITVQGYNTDGSSTVTSFGLQVDATTPTKRDLVVNGSSQNDVLNVILQGASSYYNVAAKTAGVQTPTGKVLISELQGNTGFGGKILMNANGGNDSISMTQAITTDAIIDGGSGADNIYGGNGNNIIYGGASGSNYLFSGNGNSILIGGAGTNVLDTAHSTGRNILIGGHGSSKIRSGFGDSIMIGGFTSFDAHTAANITALDAILAEWTSADSFSDRVSNIANQGLGGGQNVNGTNYLNNSTVFDNGMVDVLVGDYFGGSLPTKNFVLKGTNDVYTDSDPNATAIFLSI